MKTPKSDTEKTITDIKMKTKEYKYALKWEYCECGCHCLETSIGGILFSNFIYWPTVDGKDDFNNPFYRISHSGYTVLGTVRTKEEVESRILEYLDSKNVEQNLKNDLKAIQKLRKNVLKGKGK